MASIGVGIARLSGVGTQEPGPRVPIDVCSGLRNLTLQLFLSPDPGAYARYQLYDAAAACAFPGEQFGFGPTGLEDAAGLANEERARFYEMDGRVPALLRDFFVRELQQFAPGILAAIDEHRARMADSVDGSPSTLQNLEAARLRSGLSPEAFKAALDAGAKLKEANMSQIGQGLSLTPGLASPTFDTFPAPDAAASSFGIPDVISGGADILTAVLTILKPLADAGIVRGTVGKALAGQPAAMMAMGGGGVALPPTAGNSFVGSAAGAAARGAASMGAAAKSKIMEILTVAGIAEGADAVTDALFSLFDDDENGEARGRRINTVADLATKNGRGRRGTLQYISPNGTVNLFEGLGPAVLPSKKTQRKVSRKFGDSGGLKLLVKTRPSARRRRR